MWTILHERVDRMNNKELVEQLNKAKELLSERVSVIDAWEPVNALKEIIERISKESVQREGA